MIIVASGPSARGFVPPDDVPIIAVNGAIDWISRADYWFTLDTSTANLNRVHNPRSGVQYCAAVPPERHLPPHVRRFDRVGYDWANYPPAPAYTVGWWLRRLSCKPGLSTDPATIHTGNSSYGALGLAYHLGARRVVLVGVDATNDRRVEGGRSRELKHLPSLFASALPQVEIVSCGALDSVPQARFEDAVAWLRR